MAAMKKFSPTRSSYTSATEIVTVPTIRHAIEHPIEQVAQHGARCHHGLHRSFVILAEVYGGWARELEAETRGS